MLELTALGHVRVVDDEVAGRYFCPMRGVSLVLRILATSDFRGLSQWRRLGALLLVRRQLLTMRHRSSTRMKELP